MADPTDPITAFVGSTIALLACRRATQISLVAGIVLGIADLACGSPGWAAIMFATSAVDAWHLKHWRFSDGR